MIEHISGRMTEKQPDHVVIECNGVGYLLHISLNTYGQLSNAENQKLLVHEVIREDAFILYGFAKSEERELFRMLVSVSGVGATTARMILSSMTPKELQSAIMTNDVRGLQRIKGIGAKSAQRLIVELADKIGKTEVFGSISPRGNNTFRDEALSALVALGFDKRTADKTIDKVVAETGDSIDLEGLIKRALKYL